MAENLLTFAKNIKGIFLFSPIIPSLRLEHIKSSHQHMRMRYELRLLHYESKWQMKIIKLTYLT